MKRSFTGSHLLHHRHFFVDVCWFHLDAFLWMFTKLATSFRIRLLHRRSFAVDVQQSSDLFLRRKFSEGGLLGGGALKFTVDITVMSTVNFKAPPPPNKYCSST